MRQCQITNKDWSRNNEKTIAKLIKDGATFIYPTDTIYGLGCDATNDRSVLKIRRIKKRPKKPLSMVVPGLSWIKRNCLLKKRALKIIGQKLPGPYTFYVKIKNPKSISRYINPKDKNRTIGIRIPKHWFSRIIRKTGVPFVTTSVNVSGRRHMKSIDNLDVAIKNKVDIIIYEGSINNRKSRKIDFRND